MTTAGSSFLELWHDERLDQLELLGFEIPADDPKAYLVMPDIGMRWRDRSFRASEVEASRRGTETTLKVEAEATWYELGDRRRVGSITLIAQPALDGLAEILSTTGWTVAESSNVNTVGTMEAEDKTVLELVRTWARIVGAEIQWNTSERSVGLVSTRGRELGLAFRYGRNLLDVRRRLTPPSVTVLYPYGADSLSIAGINGVEYIEDFTYYTAHPTNPITLEEARERFTRSAVWSDPSFLVDTELLAAAQLRLASLAQGRASYECKVIDLTELTTVRETLAAGDYVRVADPDFAEDLRVRVVRLRRYPLEPWRNVVELGDSPDPSINDGSPSRPSASEEWLQFIGPTTATFLIRNDATWTTNRIPLRFRPGGRGNFHLDLWATGVGAGTMVVEVIDSVDGVSLHEPVEVAYTDGERVRAFLSWAMEDIEGPHDYRVRVTTIADGGPSETNGVDIGPDDYGEAPFYVMVQGAVRETPSAPNSQTFEFTGSVQTFTVPDNVEQVTITAKGGRGGGLSGNGGEVTATFPVTPGAVLDVYVGGAGATSSTGGAWPNGGGGGRAGSQGPASSGGGSSDVRPQGDDGTGVMIVAGAGGGGGEGQASSNNKIGGAGGFFAGVDGGPSTGGKDGGGGTQFSGGVASPVDPGNAEAGSFLEGGNAATFASNFSFAGGGGGGGYYGGGGAGQGSGGTFANGGGGGGGGSGFVDATGSELLISDGSNTGNGQVVISWESPDLG